MRYFFLLLTTTVFIVVVSCVNTPITAKYTASDTHIHYMGRVLYAADDTVKFTYPGTSIITAFDGERIFMRVKPNCGSFVVKIDNSEPYKITIGDSSRVLIADSLAWRTHHLQIMYAVEGYELKPEFYGLEVDGRLTSLRPEMIPQRSIEFIGNSITCGYGVEDNNPENHFDYATENHYKTYAAITARRLGARHTAIARSGIGIYRNYGDVREGSKEPMPAVFDRTLFGDSTYIWPHDREPDPDVVCVNLGTNDTSLDNYDISKLRSGYIQFINRLRLLYPESKIVMLTGSMLQGQALEDVKGTLNDVVESMNDENLLRFDLTPQTGELGYGADYHPSEAQQEKMAGELVAFLCESMSWNEVTK